MKKLLVFVAFTAVSLFGSATIFDGSQQNITFNTQPAGVTVKKDGMIICNATPCSVMINRTENPNITFSKDGYNNTNVMLTKSLNNKIWLNIISGGLFGSTTDSATGAMHEFQPNNIFVTLSKKTKK